MFKERAKSSQAMAEASWVGGEVGWAVVQSSCRLEEGVRSSREGLRGEKTVENKMIEKSKSGGGEKR